MNLIQVGMLKRMDTNVMIETFLFDILMVFSFTSRPSRVKLGLHCLEVQSLNLKNARILRFEVKSSVK